MLHHPRLARRLTGGWRSAEATHTVTGAQAWIDQEVLIDMLSFHASRSLPTPCEGLMRSAAPDVAHRPA